MYSGWCIVCAGFNFTCTLIAFLLGNIYESQIVTLIFLLCTCFNMACFMQLIWFSQRYERQLRYEPRRSDSFPNDIIDSILDNETELTTPMHKMCPICLQESDVLYVIVLKCDHSFHYVCLKNYFLHSYPIMKCPLCRLTLN